MTIRFPFGRRLVVRVYGPRQDAEIHALARAVRDARLDHHAVQPIGLEREGWDPPAAA